MSESGEEKKGARRPSKPTAAADSTQAELANALALAEALAGPRDPRQLLNACRQAIELAETLSDPVARGKGLELLGNAAAELGRLDEARAAYQEAADQWAALGIRDREATARRALSGVLSSLGDLGAARTAMADAAAGPGALDECESLLLRARLSSRSGEYHDALEQLEAAEQAITRAEGRLRAGLAAQQVELLLAQGQARDALTRAAEMLRTAERSHDSSLRLEAVILSGLSSLRTGDLADAWQQLDRAQQVADLAGDRLRECKVASCLSEWFGAAGMPSRAVEWGRRAVDLAEGVGDRLEGLYAHLWLANGHMILEDAEAAAEPTGHVFELAGQLGAPLEQVRAQTLKARLALLTHAEAEAQGLLDEAVSSAATLGAAADLADARVYLTEAYLALGSTADAARVAKDAVEEARRLDARPLMWRAYHATARVCLAQRRPTDAQEHLRRAIEIVENMCWPLSAVGFVETTEVSEGILRVYFDFLSTASKLEQTEEVERVLALSPWPMLRERWEHLSLPQ